MVLARRTLTTLSYSALVIRQTFPRFGWRLKQQTLPSGITGRKTRLDTRVPADAALLQNALRRSQRRNKYQSSFLNFDSDRAVRNVQQYQYTWDIGDPFQEEVNWDLAFGLLFNRYNEVRHSLFRMVENQKRAVAEQAFALQRAGQPQMQLDFPDILKPFKDAFWQLVAPKKLVELNTRDQQIYYEIAGMKLPIESLSSGEREVVNIAFDFICVDRMIASLYSTSRSSICIPN